MILRKAKEAATLEFDGVTLSFFPDLARETLERRRAWKPLTKKLREASINYRWGFPAALIANRNGKMAILCFPEDLNAICMHLNITPPELPGWQDIIPTPSTSSEVQWQKVSRKRRSATPGSTSHVD